MSALIAIVGRPNVGKSALFNRIAGRRIAIVHDQPGVTRDRVSAEVEWQGRPFTLVDTGGLGLREGEKAGDIITQAVTDQVKTAIESAHLILLVVNAQEGIVPLDREVAERLHRSGKPVLVAVNKSDHPGLENALPEFAELGFPGLFAVSAIHGRGVADLMQAAWRRLPANLDRPTCPRPQGDVTARGSLADPWKLAIVGRPNVGKSSIINALTRSQRVIVSPVPGTTRDAVDVPFEIETADRREAYLLIDTAGMRKSRRVSDSIEFFSVKRAEDSIARSDLAVLVLDAEAGLGEQDKKIAGKILEEEKACVVVINKWDLVEEAVRKARLEEIARRQEKERGAGAQMTTLAEFGHWVQEQLFFLDYAPVIFTSAQSGFHLDRLLEAIRYVTAQLRQTIPTGLLNRTLQDAVDRRPPSGATGQRGKFFYATQVKSGPPSFVLFVSRPELFAEKYRKYLVGQLRRAFGYEGCPIVLLPRPRPRTVEPIRSRPKPRRAQRGKARLRSTAS